jgi:2,3-bisphosphoglycerate-dependent phosphoglycerate mutase
MTKLAMGTDYAARVNGGLLAGDGEISQGARSAYRQSRAGDRRAGWRRGYPRNVAKLVLIRHGQSAWNAQNRFTGWVDVDLAPPGEDEARGAGELIAATDGLVIDVVHTSVLTRAVRTADITLAAAGRSFVPVHRHWRLNERHYGALQGLDKKETAAIHGAEQVKAWRRSYSTRPPEVARDSEYHPANDPRYRLVPESALPAAECLEDVVRRLVPYYEDVIAPELLSGLTVLVVAHGNSLRAMEKELEQLSDDEIVQVEIPTGAPRVYELDDRLRVVDAFYLGDPEEIRAAAEAVARQAG